MAQVRDRSHSRLQLELGFRWLALLQWLQVAFGKDMRRAVEQDLKFVAQQAFHQSDDVMMIPIS